MAATPPKPQTSTTLTTSTIPTTTIQSSTINNIVNVNNNNNKQNNNNNLNCNCTNISIMQLFHEMKQEFPTVPDHVVSQCVLDNCHNRPNCIDNLRKEALIQPIIQSYPSQILMRNNNNKRCIDNNNIIILTTQKNDDDIDITAQPITTASTTTTKNINNNNNNDLSDNYNNINNMKQSDMQQTNTNNNNNNNTNNNNNNNNSDNNNIINNRPQRPNTLNFSKEPYNPVAAFVRSGYRPTRSAPPPPSQSSSSLSSILSQQQQIHPFQQQQQISPSDVTTNNDSINVSLNVTVSPVSGRPPVRPPRHTTALNVQPESPFSRDRLLDSPRSYTSVNFTLRQPCVSPQSPIEITAGPGLTYSSSSFDARQGYQSRLQITVGGSGGVGGNSSGSTISAMRTRPLSRNNNNINTYNNNNNSITMSDDDDFGININSGQLRALSISNENLETSCYTPPHQNSEAEIVHRQLIHKNNLLGELEKDKRQLEIMQKEVRDLHAPLPPDGTSQLKDDIEQLRSDCDRMSVEVQEAGPYLLGETNEAFYQNIYSGQRLTVQTRPPRPPRPPLPIALRTNSQQLQQQQNINNNLVSSGNNINNHNNNNTATTSNNISNNNNTQNTNIINQEEQQQHWICNMCTFRNHPLLNKCEQCEMPQISSGTVINSQLLFSPRLHNMRFLNKAPPIPLPLPTTTTATSMAIGSSKSSTNIITTNNNNYHIPIHYQNGGNITIPSLPNTRNLYDNNNSSNTNTTTTQTTNSKIFSGLSRLT